MKEKSWLRHFRLDMVKIGSGQMLLVNQIVTFISRPYLKGKLMNWSDFFHGNSVLWKKLMISFLVGCGQHWAWLDAAGQSDCTIFESAISQEQIDESVLFFPWWFKFCEKKMLISLFWIGCERATPCVRL